MLISKSLLVLKVWRDLQNLLGIYHELFADLWVRRPNHHAVIALRV